MAAIFYSLIESAKLCGVEPRAYLREAAPRAIRSPGGRDARARSQVAEITRTLTETASTMARTHRPSA